ncbi:hypothetical protein PM082_008878 [Marasmius tenuissimus]|nr:hypothetical protein PM082_008878 [Marasmius tenuissimus]
MSCLPPNYIYPRLLSLDHYAPALHRVSQIPCARALHDNHDNHFTRALPPATLKMLTVNPASATASTTASVGSTPKISNATRIWELSIHWPVYSQCGVWDPRSKGVDIWECVRDHVSVSGTQPPNANYWRYLARR